jgi:diaminohydroxyphosphoribosylaminopyrimidine deaminase/5-amino-6-(5-phosphoribosylamino)uracil reductase
MTQDELFMLRALELAKLGTGSVSPNPRVGCVIVYENKIIGEGWHHIFGGPHAEVNAIDSVKDKSLLSSATLFVTLEPCSHTGKTPPCADLLIKNKIKHVIIATEDPNPLVAGRGIKKLKDAGIQVTVGLLSLEAQILNNHFFTFIKSEKPYVILKWAQTADGFIAPKSRERQWISNVYSRQLVHKWRTEVDAVLVGSDTVLFDNPELNVRDWSGRNPTRIVIDRNLKLPLTHNVFSKNQKTICYNLLSNSVDGNLTLVKIEADNFLQKMLIDLGARGVQSLLVDGGAKVHSLFIEANLWNEARLFYSPVKFGDGINVPVLAGELKERIQLGSDWLDIITNQR